MAPEVFLSALHSHRGFRGRSPIALAPAKEGQRQSVASSCVRSGARLAAHSGRRGRVCLAPSSKLYPQAIFQPISASSEAGAAHRRRVKGRHFQPVPLHALQATDARRKGDHIPWAVLRGLATSVRSVTYVKECIERKTELLRTRS